MDIFDLKNWIATKDDQIRTSYAKLTEERFYNGITFEDFLKSVITGMENNEPEDAEYAEHLLPHILGFVYADCVKIEGEESVLDEWADGHDSDFHDILQGYNALKEDAKRTKKIKRFEKHLIKNGCIPHQSGVSESRYYNFEGVKYRFSDHIYPAGSMTSEEKGVIDLGTEPELIDDIHF